MWTIKFLRLQSFVYQKNQRTHVFCNLFPSQLLWLIYFVSVCFSLVFTFPAVACPSPARQGVRRCLHESVCLSAGFESVFLNFFLWCFLTVCSRMEWKSGVGWGNHQGRGGNGSGVTLQLSLSFLPLLSLSLSASFRHTHPLCHTPTHKIQSIDCRMMSFWNLLDQEVLLYQLS